MQIFRAGHRDIIGKLFFNLYLYALMNTNGFAFSETILIHFIGVSVYWSGAKGITYIVIKPASKPCPPPVSLRK